jgi:hypothetical protein
LNVRSLNTDELLSSQIPEVVLIAVLSNYQPEQAEVVLRSIVMNLKKLVKNKRVLKKYINQLMMLSRLRKIEALTIKITEEMPIHYDYEKDTLYLKGTEKGLEQSIIKLWEKGFEMPMISNLLDVPLEKVEQIITNFKNEQKQKKYPR